MNAPRSTSPGIADALVARYSTAGREAHIQALCIVEDVADKVVALLWPRVCDAVRIGASLDEIAEAMHEDPAYIVEGLIDWADGEEQAGRMTEDQGDALRELLHAAGGPAPVPEPSTHNLSIKIGTPPVLGDGCLPGCYEPETDNDGSHYCTTTLGQVALVDDADPRNGYHPHLGRVVLADDAGPRNRYPHAVLVEVDQRTEPDGTVSFRRVVLGLVDENGIGLGDGIIEFDDAGADALIAALTKARDVAVGNRR